jgi:hypothetical protein
VRTVTSLEKRSNLLNRDARDTIEQAGDGAQVGGGEGFDGAVSCDVALQGDPLIAITGRGPV